MTDLPLTIQAIKKAYAAKTISPRELILQLRSQALAQADFNAWITLLGEAQLEPYFVALANKEMDELPLYGVPFAIKDNIDLAGVPTTAACPDFTYVPELSAPVVEALISAGAIPLGKTNLDQFATGLVGTRSPYGEGKNVFNQEYISGGSSAGSAIATALGQVAFALGTDTAGSGRVPAVLNNLIGHKPTKGLLSTRGVVPACRTLDCVSIFALYAGDAAQVLEVAAQYDEQDAYARVNTYANKKRYFGAVPSSFKFGVPDELDFFGNSETQALFQKSVEQLQQAGGTPVSISFAPFIEAAKLLYEGPWVAERWLATQNVKLESMLPVIQTIIGNGNNGKASDAFAAQYRLAELKRTCDGIMQGLDCVIAPTTPTVFTRAQICEQPVKNNSILGTYTNFMNLLDYSATAVPVGFLSSGVGWGVTLFGNAFTDVTLLSFANILQRANATNMGATAYPLEQVSSSATPCPPTEIDVVVCGAHLAGQPLNWQLTERGGSLVACTRTSPNYALYALPDGKRPALVKLNAPGSAIEVEVWRMPAAAFGSFVCGIPAPLGIGKIELEDGSELPGFICDGYGLEGAKDVSNFGGWRNWLSEKAAS